MVSERGTVPTLAKALQPTARMHRQTAIVRTVIDEMERCAIYSELSDQLNLQMIDELRRLARRVLDVADALEFEQACDRAEPSGVRLRSAV